MKKLLLIYLVALAPFVSKAQAHYDIVLINGRVVDGTGNPWFKADVGISKGKIVKIGQIDTTKAKKVINVNNRIVAPGFIDIHTHIEGDEEKTPTADNFIYDGVTSVITGNCGSSEVDLEKYFNFLTKLKTSVNIGALIGQGSVRAHVMNTSSAPPTTEQQMAMEELVEKAMKDGAMGLSTGLIYVPGIYSSTEEIVGLAKVAKKYGGIYATHMRSETAQVFEAINEAITIGKLADIPVQISHLKVGRPNWNRSLETLKMIDSARAMGLDVTCDQYPYSASSTSLRSLIPTWALTQNDSTFQKRITDPPMKKKIVDEMLSDAARRGNTDFSYAVIAFCNADTTLNGKSISQVNKLKGRPQTLEAEINTILELVNEGWVQMVFHGMNEGDIETIMKYPFTIVASDGSIREFGKGMPHPRSYGTNARVLGKYVREKELIKLEDAIKRMTSAPAQRFNLKNKGLIRPGMDADIVVFDDKNIDDLSTYDSPHAYSTGVEYVLVNGNITLKEGKHTGVRNGQILYGPGKK
ncbi:N-acyl-D-amino-acid deacylase family protein [Solitalea lacus]|uniref:N-acyl-D-amino-acid deacylase family protein n=1 Tax=Solitalea lacus TaxID=2911172 RepID=UPI001ED9CCA9|nr:D-aminoacylase [Solitalea lacus]UKJ06919.1 D-aminoacylase [Solitalea lacus]